jgi:RNA recognition motif-containing protein
MVMHIQISNLNPEVDNESLKNLFSSYGDVKSAEVVKDVFTENSRGFGFVEMEDEVAGQNAINGLHNTIFEKLTLSVEQTTPKTTHKGSYKVGNGPVEVYRFNKRNR